MKKVIGLFLVILISSSSVFAQSKGGRQGKKDMDPAKRMERMAEELKLDEKQTVEFQKINEEFQQKMEAQRKEMLAMQNERKADLKKILTEEQYQKLQEMQQPRKGPRGGNMRKEKN